MTSGLLIGVIAFAAFCFLIGIGFALVLLTLLRQMRLKTQHQEFANHNRNTTAMHQRATELPVRRNLAAPAIVDSRHLIPLQIKSTQPVTVLFSGTGDSTEATGVDLRLHPHTK